MQFLSLNWPMLRLVESATNQGYTDVCLKCLYIQYIYFIRMTLMILMCPLRRQSWVVLSVILSSTCTRLEAGFQNPYIFGQPSSYRSEINITSWYRIWGQTMTLTFLNWESLYSLQASFWSPVDSMWCRQLINAHEIKAHEILACQGLLSVFSTLQKMKLTCDPRSAARSSGPVRQQSPSQHSHNPQLSRQIWQLTVMFTFCLCALPCLLHWHKRS